MGSGYAFSVWGLLGFRLSSLRGLTPLPLRNGRLCQEITTLRTDSLRHSLRPRILRASALAGGSLKSLQKVLPTNHHPHGRLSRAAPVKAVKAPDSLRHAWPCMGPGDPCQSFVEQAFGDSLAKTHGGPEQMAYGLVCYCSDAKGGLDTAIP